MNSLPFAYKQPTAVCTAIACKHFPDLKVRMLIKRTAQQDVPRATRADKMGLFMACSVITIEYFDCIF